MLAVSKVSAKCMRSLICPHISSSVSEYGMSTVPRSQSRGIFEHDAPEEELVVKLVSRRPHWQMESLFPILGYMYQSQTSAACPNPGFRIRLSPSKCLKSAYGSAINFQ